MVEAHVHDPMCVSRRIAGDPRTAALVTASAISVAYLVVRPASADFASGDFRARLFREGAYVWNNHWFGGHPLPGYGVVSPMLNATLGVVPVAIASLVVASWAFAAIVVRAKQTRPSLPSPRLATALFAVGCGISLWGGRLTFGPAVAFGSLCVLGMQRRRPVVAVIAAALCGLSSPVGALLLAIVVIACWIAAAFPRLVLVSVAVASVVPAAALGALFPEGGWYPFTGASFLMLGGVLAVIGWWGRRVAVVRAVVIVYAVVALGAFLFRSPLGGNVVRLAWLGAAPAAALTITRFRRTLLPAFMIVTVVWGWSYVRLGFVAADASTQPRFYDSLAAFVQAQPGGVQRVEVVPTETFRQADELAMKINIARGWETQLDRAVNPELYTHLTSTTFRRWLLRNSVSLVALPLSGVRASSGDEASIIRAGPAYLRLVWSTDQWLVYRVAGAVPLASNGATVVAVGAESLIIAAPRPGAATVRFRYTRLYRVTSGDACLTKSPEGWIEMHVRTPGTITASAGFTFGALAGDSESCA